jgi:hypothetical protein
MKYAALALQLLRPKERRRLGAIAAGWIAVAILMAIAFAFAIAGVFLLLAETFGSGIGALLTAAALFGVAMIVMVVIAVLHSRKPPPPLFDPATVALVGLLVGLAGADAFLSRKNDKDET